MHFTLYQTAARLYVVRRDAQAGAEQGNEYRVLKLDRTVVEELEVAEDPTPYSQPQLQRLLAAINAGNQHVGGLQRVCEADAIVGCLKFLEGWYLLLVTKRRFLGTICGHKVYGIESTALLPILSPTAHRQQLGSQHAGTAEVRYRKMLAGVQLNKDFFFSYSWPVHQTVQQTFSQQPQEWEGEGNGPSGSASPSGSSPPATASAFSSHRVWNEFLSRPLRDALGPAHAARWVVPLAHGFFEQRPLALLGRSLQLTLVARRSRQFAGTRYLKRGVTDAGYVANDVEIEQIVEAGVDWKSGQPLLSAMVQVRGSIPLPWGQLPESSMLKPEIVLHRFDPLYASTRRHFELLREQYSDPLCVLDLVKRVERRPRESKLGCEYATAVRYLNQRLPPGQRVQYQAFDLSHHAKTRGSHLLAEMQRLQAPVLQATDIFVSAGGGSRRARQGGSARGSAGSSVARPARQQHGVLRTNCIDSLDRTNIGQFSFGLLALGQQLYALGISESARLDPASSLARHLMDQYEAMGHTLALQYGGSEAHTTFFQRQRGDWEAATQSRDLLTAVRRFYSNTYTDADKQDAINLFLGNYVPAPNCPHLWDLGSDAYLHTGPGRTLSRTTSLGSRSSFSVATAQAAAAAAAAAAPDALTSLPPPVPLPPPPAELGGRPDSPPEKEQGDHAGPPPLAESLSVTSLASLSTDGSFAPTLSALVANASAGQPQSLSRGSSSADEAAVAAAAGMTEASAAPPPPVVAVPAGGGSTTEPTTPRTGSPAATTPGGSPTQPQRSAGSGSSGPRRSPLLGGGVSRKPAKLESFDKMLSRQPVAHVRLTATPATPRQSALGWLSPGSSKSVAAASSSAGGPVGPAGPAGKGFKPKPAGGPSDKAAAADRAAAKEAAAKAVVAAVGSSISIPTTRTTLRRSNSDPSLACSLGNGASSTAAASTPRFGRHVTFDAPPSVPHPVGGGLAAPAAPAAPGGLLRQRTAPSASLARYASEGAAAGSVTPAGSVCSTDGQLLLVGALDHLPRSSSAAVSGGGVMLPVMLRRASTGGSSAYHALAGLDLAGGSAAEASIKPGPASPAATKPQRRISFPNFARLRALTRKSSLDGGSTSSSMLTAAAAGGSAGGVARSATDPGNPSLLLPSPRFAYGASNAGGGGVFGGSGGGLGIGAPEPLNMTAVVYGAEAVRRGIDTLGVPPAMSSCWITGADPLAAMVAEQQNLHAQIARQREVLATPLDPVEQRALLEQCAALMRPSWALSVTSFTQGAQQPAAAQPPAPPVNPVAAVLQPVVQHGLAF